MTTSGRRPHTQLAENWAESRSAHDITFFHFLCDIDLRFFVIELSFIQIFHHKKTRQGNWMTRIDQNRWNCQFLFLFVLSLCWHDTAYEAHYYASVLCFPSSVLFFSQSCFLWAMRTCLPWLFAEKDAYHWSTSNASFLLLLSTTNHGETSQSCLTFQLLIT